jgi:bifunctional DNase/RNase
VTLERQPVLIPYASTMDDLISTRVDSVRYHAPTLDPLVLLREEGRNRYLPLALDAATVRYVIAALAHHASERPQPWDVLIQLVAVAGAELGAIEVRWSGERLLTTIEIRRGSRGDRLEAGIGDAVAVAVRQDVPLLVDRALMDGYGITIGQGDADEPVETGLWKQLVNTMELPDLE